MSRSREDDEFIFGNKGFGNDEELKQKYLERISKIKKRKNVFFNVFNLSHIQIKFFLN